MQLGRLYQAAPELRVRTWIDGSGEPMDTPLRLDDLGYKSSLLSSIGVRGPSSGSPTLQRFYRTLKDGGGFGFPAIQTVFEGEAETRSTNSVSIKSGSAYRSRLGMMCLSMEIGTRASWRTTAAPERHGSP